MAVFARGQVILTSEIACPADDCSGCRPTPYVIAAPLLAYLARPLEWTSDRFHCEVVGVQDMKGILRRPEVQPLCNFGKSDPVVVDISRIGVRLREQNLCRCPGPSPICAFAVPQGFLLPCVRIDGIDELRPDNVDLI